MCFTASREKDMGPPQENTLPFLPSPSHPSYGFSCRARTSPPIQSHMCSMFIGTGFHLDLPFQIPPYEEHLRSSLTIPSARLVGNFHPRKIKLFKSFGKRVLPSLGLGCVCWAHKGGYGSKDPMMASQDQSKSCDGVSPRLCFNRVCSTERPHSPMTRVPIISAITTPIQNISML